MKILGLAFACLFAVVLCGASGCEENVAEKYGIKIKENPPGSGKYVVVEDPAHGQIGQAVEIAQGATSGVPIAGQIMGGVSLLSSLLYGILLKRAKARADEMNAEHENTHAATALGLQTAVNAMTADQAKILIAHLDAAHDALDVHAEHQDALQPVKG